MALSYKALMFTVTSATTAGNTIDLTGFGFQPTAYFVTWNGRSEAVDTVGAADLHIGFGAATDSTHRGCQATFQQNGQASCVGGSRFDDGAVIQVCDAAGNMTGSADHDSFLADGIRIIIDDQFPADLRILVEAWGGTTNATVITVDHTPNGSAALDITGLGFDPGTDSYFRFFGMSDFSAPAPPSAHEDFIQPAMAAARSRAPIQQYMTLLNADDDSATMDVDSWSGDDRIFHDYPATGLAGTPFATIRFDGPISDGFRVTRPGGVIANFFVLVIKGGAYELGELLTQTDTTTDIVESGFGFQPIGVTFVSHCQAKGAHNNADSSTSQTGGAFSVGAATSTSDEIALGSRDEDATAGSELQSAIEHDAVYARVSASAAIEGLMKIQSIDSDGFTCRMDDADPDQAFVWYTAYAADAIAQGDFVSNKNHSYRRRRV